MASERPSQLLHGVDEPHQSRLGSLPRLRLLSHRLDVYLRLRMKDPPQKSSNYSLTWIEPIGDFSCNGLRILTRVLIIVNAIVRVL